MNIQDALKETGKAVNEKASSKNYVKIRDCGVLSWYDQGRDIYLCDVPLDIIIGDDWQPYHEVKEIRPEKAGELWKRHDEYSLYYATFKYQHRDEIKVKCLNDGIDYDFNKPFFEKMIHGKNGWTRLFPKVEDESVERIEIEGVAWRYSHGIYFPIADTDIEFSELKDKGRMKMILEIPKETS